jgi:hypothetical protein
MSQFPLVNCQYGAPMGRRSYGLIQNCESRTVRLFRVNLDQGGYDDGGAYWGTGEPIYCATDTPDLNLPIDTTALHSSYFATVRASNRAHACLLLGIEREQLKQALKDIAWLRWGAVLVYAGQPSPVWEVSEFGKPLGFVRDWLDLCHFAQTCIYSQGSGLKVGEGLHLYNSTPIATVTR